MARPRAQPSSSRGRRFGSSIRRRTRRTSAGRSIPAPGCDRPSPGADGSCSTRPRHSAHRTEGRTLRYPWHPLYGVELEVRVGERYPGALRFKRGEDERFGFGLIPEWMFDEARCAAMRADVEAHVSVGSLVELRRLLAEPSTTEAMDGGRPVGADEGDAKAESSSSARLVAVTTRPASMEGSTGVLPRGSARPAEPNVPGACRSTRRSRTRGGGG